MLYCRVLPLAGIVDAACTRIIAGATQHQDIIAQARSWSRAAASIASTLEASRSTKPSRGLSLRPLNRQSSALLLPLLNGLKLIARPRSSNGVSVLSGQATKLAVRSDVIVPSIQITGWSPVALSANGKRA